MARRTKNTYRFTVAKNQVPQGAWLAYYTVEGKNGDGELGLVDASYAAFTTANAAKRHCAHAVGRSRLTWTDIDGDKMTLTASTEVAAPEQ